MTKNILISFILLFSLPTFAQFPRDSIVFVYFHKVGDTLMKIDKEYSYIDRTYLFNLNKVFYDISGVNLHYTQILKSKNLKDFDPLLDSITKANYVLGTNKSNKCINSIKVVDIKKLKSDKYGYVAEYTIKDIRILNGDTIENSDLKKNKHYVNKDATREKLMEKSYQQISFAWSSFDNRITYFLLQNIITTIQDDGSEIETSTYKCDMKKLKR